MSGCKPLLLCADDEYMRDESCEKCNNTMSFVLVGVSLLSFVAIIYVVDLKSQQQGTMIGIKSVTAFYQSAQLTTLVSIPWPKIALWAPFTVPYGDANCLTNQVGWNQQLSFFVYVYGTLIALGYLRRRASRRPKDSAERRSCYEQFVLLTVISYSPLVQNATSMYRCVEDPDLGLVLASDARVSCEMSVLRTATIVHAIAVIVVVGFGLPLFVVWKMLQLRREDKLDVDSIYAGLFEWYALERPYWEAVQLFKKLLLVLAGSLLAILGAVSRSLVDVFGTIFAIMNIAYVNERSEQAKKVQLHFCFCYFGLCPDVESHAADERSEYVLGVIYAFTKSGGSDKIAPMLTSVTTRGGVSPITKQASGWKSQVKAIEESEGLKPETVDQMKKELKLLQGKVVANIEKELKAASDKGEEERGAVFKEANELIACIDADAKRLHGADVETVGRAEKLVPDLWFAHLVKGRRWAAVQAMAVDEEAPTDAAAMNSSGQQDAIGSIDTPTTVKIPREVTSLVDGIFEGLASLKQILMHDGITSIGDSAFRGCSSLEHVKIPAGVTHLRRSVFEGCTALITVDAHSDIEWIDRSAFKDCSALKAWAGGLKEGAQVHHEAFLNCNALLKSPSTPGAIRLLVSQYFELAEPFRCLGGPIKSRVTNTAAARNAARLVLWSRWGLLLDTVLRCYIAAELTNLMGVQGDAAISQIITILFTVPALASFTLMLDVRPLLEGTRASKAKIFWLFGSRTSLFGWVYMKLKFLIMFQSMLWLVWFSFYEPDKIKEASDQFEDRYRINLETFSACVATQVAVALLTYLVMYHCLKRIDQDDRRNVFPSHDYRADAVCCCKPCRGTPLLGCYWLVYAIVFLFFTYVLYELSVSCSHRYEYEDDDYESPDCGKGSTIAILATCLFGCMVAHQCYYNQEANKVASVEGESEDIEEVA
ncbi:hypothetical protein TeGR_g5200 [Tetraparma gracilis]|uniref:Uncharacterized protein n=1 Tax=Tetraparma gracilis TaxID=2962635 RepID=A0ABQ6MSQ9_9STRA|nr:hypothetical protein TeGR_g5200 [Tetraparma gracilis]